MQRGSMLLAFGFATLVAGVLALKLTDLNMFWLVIAAGAIIGSYGGISVSKRARPQ
jgi:uncharacterized membrane protein YqgA involved in biofilm formation